jgi:putative phosphoribosyl transferase
MMGQPNNDREQSVSLRTATVPLEGNLTIPGGALGVVLFAHGGGSGRNSPRNQFVASVLREAGFATLLLDLLSPAEQEADLQTRRLRFDIGLLADRLLDAVLWVNGHPATRDLRAGLFGASTGAAAALVAAAQMPDVVEAVVSRGGRPDLAGPALPHVAAPTLLIVGGDDAEVIEMNRAALARLRAETKLAIVPGASHLFEQPDALEAAASLACEWFLQHLRPRP